MKLFIFRHNKFQASWSQFTEPNVYRSGYMFAEISVLAHDLEEAYKELSKEVDWDLEELKRLTPIIVDLDQPKVVSSMIHGG